jgi:hypothetical protein
VCLVRFGVESPVPPGRKRTLIHPGPDSPIQVTIGVTHSAAPVLMRAVRGAVAR